MQKITIIGAGLLLAATDFLNALNALPFVPQASIALAVSVLLLAILLIACADVIALPNTLDTQSKGCWAYLQIGYTAILFRHLWRRDYSATAWLQVYIAAPARSRAKGIGYERVHYGIWLFPNFKVRGRRAKLGFSWRGPDNWCALPRWMTYA